MNLDDVFLFYDFVVSMSLINEKITRNVKSRWSRILCMANGHLAHWAILIPQFV